MIANVSPDFLSQIIGKPYVDGGQGPDSFDCWGLVRYIYKEALKIQLTDYSHVCAFDVRATSEKFEEGADSSDWVEIDKPEGGCIVAMSRSKVIHHVGFWLDIDGGLCLHALDGQSVVAQSMDRLKQERFARILFFKYGKNLQNQ